MRKIEEGQIPFVIDTVSGISHNKIMICDGKKVLTGSFNWTEGAQYRNAENVLLVEDQSIAESYTQNWLKRWKESQ